MRYLLSFFLFMCIMLSGCLVSTQKKSISKQKEATAETSSAEKSKDPYGKYSLETADVEVWFYDDHFLYLDRDRKVIKNYETIDRESN